MFADPELTRDTPPLKMRDFASAATRNDCEPVVRARHPEVGEALDWLGATAPARLTGTGSCVFAEFPSEGAACDVAAEAPERWGAFVTRGIDVSPLHTGLASEAVTVETRVAAVAAR